MKGLYILSAPSYDLIYGEAERRDLAARLEVAGPLAREAVQSDPSVLAFVDVVLSGWGGPLMDDAFLAAAPNLKLVLYGAGSVKGIVTESFWKRGIRLSSAYAANAVPVAEYTLSQILFCLKHGWHYALAIKREQAWVRKDHGAPPGGYGSTVGLISLGMIGRRVCRMLKDYDLRVLAYDPFVTDAEARELGAERVGLDELFRRSDVVSLHTPWLKETENMIRRNHFEAMKQGASFINTARGAIVCEPEMIGALQRRPDLFAVLDVTYPEPPAAGSPLYTLPNVALTPHIAGSMGAECTRMGRYMVEEFDRFLAGQRLEWEITEELAKRLA